MRRFFELSPFGLGRTGGRSVVGSGVAVVVEKKWSPGPYIHLFINTDTETGLGVIAASPSNIKGAHQAVTWVSLETAPGVFGGFDALEARLDAYAAAGLKLMIQLRSSTFDDTEPVNIPADMVDNATYGMGVCTRASDGWRFPVLWNDAVRDRFIAFIQVFAARFDSHPALESFEPLEESAPHVAGGLDAGLNPGVPAFSIGTFFNNYRDIHIASAAAFTQTMTLCGVNFPKFSDFGPDYISTHIAVPAAQYGYGLALTDTLAGSSSLALSYADAKSLFPGLVGIVPLAGCGDYQGTDDNNGTVTTNYDLAVSLGMDHYFQIERTDNSVLADFRTYVATKGDSGGFRTACPSMFPACAS